MSSTSYSAQLFPVLRPPARVVIVAGKGGVGKTTVSAVLAYLAAASGLATLIVEVEGKSGLPELFGVQEPLGYQETTLLPAGAAGEGSVMARTLTPDDALLEYLEDKGLRRISRRLTATGTLDVIATAVPGIKDILVLGKVKQLEQSAGGTDLILVDAPAAGHAVTFLSSAYGLMEAAAVGPIRQQASDVVAMLSDPARAQVVLVTLAEETPVNEAVDTAFHLEDRAGVKLGPVVVNGLWPALDLPDSSGEDPVAEAVAFRKARQDLQLSQLGRLANALPLDQIRLPFLFTTELGLAELGVLSAAMSQQLDAVGWSA